MKNRGHKIAKADNLISLCAGPPKAQQRAWLQLQSIVKYVIWCDFLYWVKLSCSAMVMRVTINNTSPTGQLWTKSGPSWREEAESSERHEVLFTRTFRRRENVFPIIANAMNAPEAWVSSLPRRLVTTRNRNAPSFWGPHRSVETRHNIPKKTCEMFSYNIISFLENISFLFLLCNCVISISMQTKMLTTLPQAH